MAAKKKATKTTTTTPTPAPAKAPVTPSKSVPAGGISAEDLAVLEGDIDSRMAALLKDHEGMGARPK